MYQDKSVIEVKILDFSSVPKYFKRTLQEEFGSHTPSHVFEKLCYLEVII